MRENADGLWTVSADAVVAAAASLPCTATRARRPGDRYTEQKLSPVHSGSGVLARHFVLPGWGRCLLTSTELADLRSDLTGMVSANRVGQKIDPKSMLLAQYSNDAKSWRSA